MNRTAEVKRLFLAGKNIDEICEELELNDREKRHQAAAIIRKTKQGLNIGYQRPGVGDRGEEITRLRLSGKSINEISKLTGLSANSIEYYFKCNNVKKPKKPKEPGKLVRDDLRVRELLKQGKNLAEIMESTGMSDSYIYKRAKELGIKFTERESHEDIAELRRSGKSISEICEITGKQRKVISAKCRRIGLRESEEEIIKIRKELCANNTICNRHSETWARDYVFEKSNGVFEYLSGYINMDSPVIVRCVECGDVTKKSMIAFRSGNNHPCTECQKREAQIRAEAKAETRRIAKEKKEDARRIRACSGIQATFKFCQSCGAVIFGSHSLKWCDECRKKRESKTREITRRLKIKNALVDSDITLNGLLRRDGYACHICGGLCDVNDYIKTDKTIIAGNNYPSIDHVVPLAKGGLHSWDNVKVAHRICNSLKGDSYDKA